MRQRSAIAMGLLLGVTGLWGSAQASEVELSDVPLFISASADPNLMFILDDSGSMQWGFIPDGLVDDFNIGATGTNNCDGRGAHGGINTCFYSIDERRFAASNETNPMYYDPDTEYNPPLRGDGTQYPDADFNDAWIDGYMAQDETNPETVDLQNDYRAIMDNYFWKQFWVDEPDVGWVFYEGFTVGSTASGDSGERAFYYEFEGGAGCDERPYPDSCFGNRQHPDSEEQRQNFANWHAYYRNRILASRAAITAAFIDQPENMRIGYDAIDNHRNSVNEVERGVRPFTDEPGDAYGDDDNFRSDFFDWLQTTDARGATPLRNALMASGEYYEDSSDTGPWAANPGVADGESVDEFIECRPSISILMTDGYWNQSLETDLGNVDGSSGDPISGPGGREYPGYEPEAPFDDQYENTLADVAMHFWNRDLQPDIANRVPTNDGDEGVPNPAFWQHMVTYGIGLGVEGNISADEAFAAIEDGSTIDWPDPRDGDPEKIDDLLHASVNARGGFFSTNEPDVFADELSSLLGDLAEQLGASTGVTFDTATLEEDSLLFAAQFESGRWSGDLFASPLITDDEDGTQPPEIGAEVWSAADLLDERDLEANPRQIITSDGEVGVPFRWSEDDLNQDQQDDLRFGGGSEEDQQERAQNRVDYLRGDRSMEDGEDGFRVRDSRLGDIVNSTPVRVSSPASGWPDEEHFGEDENRYSDFRAEQDGRTPVIYSGANDGMLHGFEATEEGGEELLAFMPSAIFSDSPARGLHYLTSNSYSHRYYVDLPPLAADAFIRGRDGDGAVEANPDWRTVLLGGSRTGERAIFALDVTDPDQFDEANAAELMLWEFTDEHDDRMGFITEPPTIALAEWSNNDYRWTAFFGNGYNSEEEATGIFMLDLEGGLDGDWEEGDDYRFIEFRGEGDGNVTGLSPVAVYDDTGDRVVDRLYGGDLDGNLWVAEASNQGIGNPDTYRLFSAEVDDEVQPITAAPLVIRDVLDDDDDGGQGGGQGGGSSSDRLVLFGTGQYLNTGDLGDQTTQSFYAVRDQADADFDRDDLTARDLFEDTVDGTEVLLSEAVRSNDTIEDGWYVDVVEEGERITLSPQVRGDFIFVSSSIPSDNPCVAGGSSRVMAFGLDGLTPDIPVFEAFDAEVVSYKMEDGIASESAFLGNFLFTPTSTGEVSVEGVDTGVPDDLMGRQGWQELID